MDIAIRAADLKSDRQLLIDTLSRYLNPQYDEARFEWLYRDNPYGQASAWIAQEPTSTTIVGTAAAFPRPLSIEGREVLGWVLGDFCIAEGYRSVGPALQLQRACLAAVDAGAVACCYDLPSQSMMAIYRRLRLNPAGQMLRLAKPLRVNQKVKDMVRTPVIAGGLNAVGNTMLRLWDWKPRVNRSTMITLHNRQCSEEFSILARKVSSHFGMCVQRSAAYLNWRFLANPLHRCEVMTAHRDDALVGYTIFTQQGEDATILDLLGVQELPVIRDLIENVVSVVRTRGAVTITAPMLDSHPWVATLQRLGFAVRDASPLVVYFSPYYESQRSAIKGRAWHFMHGDRDA